MWVMYFTTDTIYNLLFAYFQDHRILVMLTLFWFWFLIVTFIVILCIYSVYFYLYIIFYDKDNDYEFWLYFMLYTLWLLYHWYLIMKVIGFNMFWMITLGFVFKSFFFLFWCWFYTYIFIGPFFRLIGLPMFPW